MPLIAANSEPVINSISQVDVSAGWTAETVTTPLVSGAAQIT